MTEVPEHWRDDPITSADQDRLHRVDLAKRVASLIAETFSPESSVVHGLVGPWGSGKSSVLALVEHELKERAGDWVVVRFNPWATSDLTGLLAEFHGAIVEVLPRRKGAAAFKRGLSEVMNATAPVASIAGSLVGASAAGEVLAKGGEILAREKSWAARFADASNELRKLRIKLLVIADDIDRLHGEELFNFLKLVRLVGRFPGMSYLIAYDEAGLLASIEAAGTSVSDPERAQDFLEKFVQYPVYIPPLLESQILALLNAAIGPVIEASEHRFTAEDGRLSLARAWTDLLDSPRAINRFASQLRLVLPLYRAGEVDLVDVILLTLLRLHAPKVYDDLIPAKGVLTTVPRGDREFPWDMVVGERVSANAAPAVRELIERLFPAATGRPAVQDTEPRVANPEYFDRYLLQGIPDEDIADATVRFAIREADRGNGTFLDVLFIRVRTADQAQVMVSKLQRFSNWGSAGVLTPPVALGVVLRRLKDLPLSTKPSIFRPGRSLLQWATTLLLGLPGDTTEQVVSGLLEPIVDPGERQALLEAVVRAVLDGTNVPPGVRAVASTDAAAIVQDLIAHLRQGDAADPNAPTEFWRWTVRALAPDAGRELITAAIADGLALDELASRFVDISRWHDDQQVVRRVEIRGFDWEGFNALVPVGLVFPAPPGVRVDGDDVSWVSRRNYALTQLTDAGRTESGPSPSTTGEVPGGE